MKIQIYFAPLPDSIHGATIQDAKDSSFIVACSTASSVQRRRHSFGHELAHIFLGHFDTAATLNIDTAGAALKVSYQGEEIRKDDSTPLHLNAEPWELEADAAAWSFYRRFRDQFIQAEKTGRATIIL